MSVAAASGQPGAEGGAGGEHAVAEDVPGPVGKAVLNEESMKLQAPVLQLQVVLHKL